MYGVGIYNTLVRLRNRFENAFSQIEVQLKRRYDLIPNLVETVKGYMAHEKGTLEAVINARNQAVGGLKAAAAAPGDAAAMHALWPAPSKRWARSLGRLFALAEAYPDLKANQNMAQLTEELTSTENKVAFARQAYNDAVTQYNTYRQSFPPVFFARHVRPQRRRRAAGIRRPRSDRRGAEGDVLNAAELSRTASMTRRGASAAMTNGRRSRLHPTSRSVLASSAELGIASRSLPWPPISTNGRTTPRRTTKWLVAVFPLAVHRRHRRHDGRRVDCAVRVDRRVPTRRAAFRAATCSHADAGRADDPARWPAAARWRSSAAARCSRSPQLRGGGHVVAESLGGRRVFPDTTDPVERRLLNVVEEMALASGVPVPPVFMLDDEAAINAFAAGYSPSDAVVAVTRGCAEQLTRDELQGVVAHEFSHILNGDMRLNIRLIGLLFGILLVGLMGRTIVRSMSYGRLAAASSDSKNGGGAIYIFARRRWR